MSDEIERRCKRLGEFEGAPKDCHVTVLLNSELLQALENAALDYEMTISRLIELKMQIAIIDSEELERKRSTGRSEK